ncbi:Auxin efflux carrier component [Quillaja saponaria]|uniref:Auxin efflux carrier component n=1 Tax=Quillaja saponaria TaxID=32244 RepID=A0AAD7PXF3_QUISA|nr:Auxin efflux carrier component [Quillaja saponaria]
MISSHDVYHIVASIIPLYVTMILAYVSVKWWKLFTPDQCSGINKFVAKFSIPLLSFQVISSNNLYNMNLKLMFSDFLQKLIAFLAFTLISKIIFRGDLKWIITGLSLSTLPNTLILGIPLLRAMYGDEAVMLLVQIVVLQSIIWNNLLLFLYELHSAKPHTVTTPAEGTGDMEAAHREVQIKEEEEEARSRTEKRNKTFLILLTVGKKLIRNPNTHATLIGLIWASIHFRWGVNMPKVVNESISILSNGGLGMAMFSLGLFMASRRSILACGTRKAVMAMGLKFVVGPSIMAVASLVFGLRGKFLRVAIVQASLPQGIVPFVFAKEYNIYPDILSTGVFLGMLLAIPVALAYYFLLAL